MATVFYTDEELVELFEVKTISMKQKRQIILLAIFDICAVVLMLVSCIMDKKEWMVYKDSEHDHSKLEQSSIEVSVPNAAISADNIDFHVADKETGLGTRFKNALLFYSRVLSIFWQYDS